ncbi:hypothetical protein EX895_005777 [Sporisorium graminicola]|uniref:Uncharacterized protein n=1 Tax=Sporisorium graminicola TaxID=280036 RepID=A0A4U7KML0_9BASI|nr:hypothetical protein EX895_005777 [Sporisorium graminicola]TKY85615.1 hypothetical protein EX895_005777 [Sporisorium graminicola]
MPISQESSEQHVGPGESVFAQQASPITESLQPLSSEGQHLPHHSSRLPQDAHQEPGIVRESPSNSSIPSSIERHDAFKLIAETLYWQVKRQRLFAETALVANGVAIRTGKADYVHFPSQDPRLEAWVNALHGLNCEAAFTLTSSVAAGITGSLAPGTLEVCLTGEDRVQVVETVHGLSRARKAQGACFVRAQRCLIVWADDVKDLVEAGMLLEEKMVNYIWEHTKQISSAGSLPNLPISTSNSSANFNASSASSVVEKGEDTIDAAQAKAAAPRRARFARIFSTTRIAPSRDDPKKEKDDDRHDEKGFSGEDLVEQLESGEPQLEEGRSVNMFAPLYTGLSLGLNIFLSGLLIRRLVIESLLDGRWIRMTITLAVPFIMCIIQFFCESVISVIVQMFLPVSQLHRNSLYFSGKRSARLPAGRALPHFTVAMPVYKEGLDSVLAPTIESVKKAIAVYELQGGTANIFVSEDGMQLLPRAEQDNRRDYYDRNNVAWVARPGHGKKGYVRKGRFKKASNLNFSWSLSLKVEEIMDELRPDLMASKGCNESSWCEDDEKALYDEAFKQAVASTDGQAWAAGDIRIGSYILLIDSDTRVPSDCFMDAACELERSPEIGALQHCSGVMYVADHYFERMIGYFTKMVNLSISWCVANGSIAPLVGHNAFLRWRAVQEVIYHDVDGERCIWSHQHVSEDFDMALRLLMKGFLVRWATYSNDEFLEGVSLTCDDEVNRWQKYAFGCSELVFNPLRYWPTRGPLSPLFRTFLWSKCSTTYKVNACSYIFSYWAIASATPLTMVYFFVHGFFSPTLDGAFLPSFQSWLSVLFVFCVGGMFGHVIFKFRAGKATLPRAILDHIKWVPAFSVFFAGMSYHVLLALMAHITGYNMTWSATVKDVTESNFWKEIPAILRRFGHCYLVMFTFMAAMIIFSSSVVPLEWRIEGFTVLWPGIVLISCHVLYPIVLNPWLVRFEF